MRQISNAVRAQSKFPRFNSQISPPVVSRDKLGTGRLFNARFSKATNAVGLAQTFGTSFFHLRRVHLRHRDCKLDSVGLPPLLSGIRLSTPTLSASGKPLSLP